MADENLLTAEPDVSGILEAAGGLPPALPPEAAMPAPTAEELAGVAPPAGAGEPDLEALLASIDLEEAPQQQGPPPEASAGDLADLLMKMRGEGAGNAPREEHVDVLQQRLQTIETQIQQIAVEKQALASQKTRDNIQSAIQGTILEQLHGFNIDPGDPEGEAFTKLVTHSAMVAVAKEQARTGSNEVDLKSVSKTVQNYSNLAVRFARALSQVMSKNQRRGPAGGTKQPFTPSKAPGQMSEAEFDAAVMAAFKSIS